LDEAQFRFLESSSGLCDGREDTADALSGWVGLKARIDGTTAKIAGKPVR
jgi:hypothetical protein